MEARTLPGLLLFDLRGRLIGSNPVADNVLSNGSRGGILRAIRASLKSIVAGAQRPGIITHSPAGPFLQTTFRAGRRTYGLQAFWLNHQPRNHPPLVAVLCERITAGRSNQRELGKAGKRFRLSPREIDIVQALRVGMSDKEIAAKLGISFETVRDYLKTIRRKIGVSTRTAIINALLTA